MIYIVLSIILIFCIALLLYMIKEAFEHNVLHHVIELKGVCEEQ
ncbi:serine/threonine protein phosphatase, partial [Butyricicoccus sp. 1XD8-22]